MRVALGPSVRREFPALALRNPPVGRPQLPSRGVIAARAASEEEVVEAEAEVEDVIAVHAGRRSALKGRWWW